MKYGMSSSKLILLDGAVEEDDAHMVTYSYIFHVTLILSSLECDGLNVKCLWNNANLPHLWNILPPTHILLKNTSSRFLLHSIVETKSRTVGGVSSPC